MPRLMRPGAALVTAARDPADLDVFAVGADRLVANSWWSAEAGWCGRWEHVDSLMMPLSGESTPPPDPRLTAVVIPGTGEIRLFAVGSDGVAYTAWWGGG
jgi:hypothetical protein